MVHELLMRHFVRLDGWIRGAATELQAGIIAAEHHARARNGCRVDWSHKMAEVTVFVLKNFTADTGVKGTIKKKKAAGAIWQRALPALLCSSQGNRAQKHLHCQSKNGACRRGIWAWMLWSSAWQLAEQLA